MEDIVFPFDLDGDELHERLGGGLPKSAIMLIEAENGVGKSVLAQRIVYGVSSHDVSVSYISTELTTQGYVKQMNSLGYKIKQKLFDNKMLFVSSYPSLGEVKYDKNFFYRLLGTPQIFEKDVIVVDTLSNIIIDKEISAEDAFNCIKFLKQITSLGKSIIICVDPGELSGLFLGYLRGVSDIYLTMSVKEQYGSVIKQINVERYNGAVGLVESPIPYKVLAGVGLALEIASSA